MADDNEYHNSRSRPKSGRPIGRPRSESASEKEEKRKEQRRKSYERKKNSMEIEKVSVEKENRKMGRPRQKPDDDEEQGRREKWNTMYERRTTEGALKTGRPKVDSGDPNLETKKEKRRQRYVEKKKKQMVVKMNFPISSKLSNDGLDKEDEVNDNNEVPPPILKSFPHNRKRNSRVLLMSPSKEAQQRAVRPTDDVTPKLYSALASLSAPKQRRSSSPNTSAPTSSTVSPFSTPSTSRASSPAPYSSETSPSTSCLSPQTSMKASVSTTKKRRGPRRIRDREPLGVEKKKKQRIQKRERREEIRRYQQQMRQAVEKNRSQMRVKMQEFRAKLATKKKDEKKEDEEKILQTALKVATNLRARLDQNRGQGTMEKEERAFRRMVTEALVSGPMPMTRNEIHDTLGISGKMVTAARKSVVEAKSLRGLRGHQFKSRFVTSALERKRKTTKFAEKRDVIKRFYEDNSTPTSRKRDVVRAWVSGCQEIHQKRFLSDSLTHLHAQFIKAHGPVSRGLFFALRPKWIITPKDSDRQVCLCASHTNLKFAFEDAISNCKRCNLPIPTMDHYVDLVESMLCPDETRSRQCITEECDQCGVGTLNESIFNPWSSAPPEVKFTFRVLEKDEKGRLGVQVKKDCPPNDFITHFKKKLSGFPLHRFLAKNQKDELDKLLENLPPGFLVILRDFAQKHAAKELEEVQSLHWHSVLVTLFTTVAMFLALDPVTGLYKKVKVYLGFFSERPEQDHYMASHCDRQVVQWIKEKLNLTFNNIVLTSDKCAGQFCSRKVFGSIAESRKNLCINHNGSEPLCSQCPRIIIHFSSAGHGKCEVDHVGALLKTNLRKETLAGRVHRNVEEVVNHVQTLNFLDLQRTRPGKEDNKGFFYSGLHTELVKPNDVSTPNVDWERIEGTRDLHQLITTDTPGELLVRESSCFSCPECEFGEYVNCRRTNDLGPVSKVVIRRIRSSVPTARTAMRTRAGEDQHRHEVAELATPGSIIAIARGQRQKMVLILVTKTIGQLSNPNELKGKILVKVDGASNQFTSTGATLFTFDAGLVRSPPLHFESRAAVVDGKELTVMKIEEFEFNALVNEFLF